ncbi:MAG: hypothetical protein GY952_17435 [Rhodobacteraceae bacterium]|nr:hypothetical protein [Paracoccaceae bacterium]
MTTHLYLAPAGYGKTAYVLERIHQARTSDPLTPITVILPNHAQVSAFRRRLSAGGGAMGVTIGTFYTLYAEILAWGGKPEPRLPEPVQYRLIRSIIVRLIDEGSLPYYAPLRDKPGFAVALRAMLEELKRTRIRRDEFKQAIQTLPNPEPRLSELAEVYTAYQDWLYTNGWADTEGQGWLAALALNRQPDLAQHLHLLVVDGFDEFHPTQLDVLKFLAERAPETIITLTGEQQRHRGASLRLQAQGSGEKSKFQNLPSNEVKGPNSKINRPAFRRFTRALQAVTQALSIDPQPLPAKSPPTLDPSLAYLEANLFEPSTSKEKTGNNEKSKIEFLEAQNRAGEVRAALRWLKKRLIRDRMPPSQVALIARDVAPYRPFIEEVAAEFGLSLHLREGLNLSTNPAIAALLSLLLLPTSIENAEGNWARRPLIDAWRSPYFENLAPNIAPRDADRLDAVARQGLVIRGLDQWRKALTRQVNQASDKDASETALIDEDLIRPDRLTKKETLALQQIFEAFVARLTPPPSATLHEYAALIEDLIGEDPKLDPNLKSKIQNLSSNEVKDPKSKGLGIVNRAWAVETTAPRDIAALRAFKDVLRGLVLAEASLNPSAEIISYDRFYEELRGAVQGATYYLPPPEPLDAALPVLSALNARGLSFRAVALIGLSEGEFPRAEREDILLREEDRRALRKAGLVDLESRLSGDEITLFYQAVTRAREKLLLCRPYLADDGQKWEPSPYWDQAHRLVGGPIQHIRPEDPLPLSQTASPQELIETGLLIHSDFSNLDLPERRLALDAARVQHGAAILQARLDPEAQGLFEGDLTHLSSHLSAMYGPEHIWSSSRLEAYGLCPHHFWLGQDLALEPRLPPGEGFDIFILGTIYHEILEEVYTQINAEANSENLLALLPDIAKKVFDKAPVAYGFRPTALWEMQRRELEQIMAETLAALAEATAGSTPLAQEQVFGMKDQPPLVVQRDGDEFRVRGFIDRVDQDANGRLRIIDYKSGSTPIAPRDMVEGRRLQIALYALAARDALSLGDIADGYYWHIGSAKASSLKLEKFEGGVDGALHTAIHHAFNHVAGVRAGRFPPAPPAAGCPGHCPGTTFCWRYKTKGY